MLRLATPHDLSFIRTLAEDVFSQFGDYGRILSQFFHTPGVATFVWEVEDRPTALGMIYLEWDSATQSSYADLLALAVVPSHQAQGVGGQLLEALFEWSGRQGARTMHLSVADTNLRAQRFFLRHGFSIVVRNDGHYPAGQRAHRMAKPLTVPQES